MDNVRTWQSIYRLCADLAVDIYTRRSKKLTSRNITIASSLGVLAPCSFFHWPAEYLKMLLTKVHCFLSKTLCLTTDLQSCIGALRASTDNRWQGGQLHIKIASSLNVLVH